MERGFVLRGDICYSKNLTTFATAERAYLVCEKGVSRGVFTELPEQFKHLPLTDYGDRMIIPGLIDLHVHAPQFSFRGLGMDTELLDWLNTHAFPEEIKFSDLEYAAKAYRAFVEDIKKGPNTRAVIFATVHAAATEMLMDMLDSSGMVTMVGKVNMDRNSAPGLQELSAERSAADTVAWLESTAGKYKNTYPILTPRFIPACTDELMEKLGVIAGERNLPVQSHLSETIAEVEWVKKLCPWAECYGDAYDRFGLFGGQIPTIMAHCVYSGAREIKLMRDNGVFVAHSPQSNTNLASGAAPIRRYLDEGLRVGLASDVAGGCDTSLLRVMRSAIEVSKLRWRLAEQIGKPLTAAEVFYLGTVGGGSFFGKVGSFESGYEFDAVVIDDSVLAAPFKLSIEERAARIIYFADDRHVTAKYARGEAIFDKSGRA